MTKFSAYVDKSGIILDRCRNRKVLHLGCVGFTDSSPAVKQELARQSLHAKLSQICDCTGVDLDGETILLLGGVFTNVIEGNVEHLGALSLTEKSFDCVVAGDIIEHLSNPGLMLDGIRPLLGDDGVLLLSTPHAFGLLPFMRHALGRFVEGRQHVLSFNAIALSQLLERHGYEVETLHSCYQPEATTKHALGFALGRFLFRMFPHLGGTLFITARVRANRE